MAKDSKEINGKGGKRPGAGRPKGARSLKTIEIQNAAKKYAGDALKALADIARNGESEGARVSAASVLLDRAYGKAPQAITGADGGPLVVSVVYSHE